MATASLARQPRSIVKVNGVAMPFFDWEIDSNTHYQADSFRLKLPIQGLPAGYGASYWSAQPTLTVEIFAGFPTNVVQFSASDLTSLFYGKVDDLTMDQLSGSIEVSGRDLTAEMIDTKTSAKYPNLTSSQIVAKIAAAHGLANAITATSTPVGRYYQIDKVRLQNEQTEWDLLTWLAREEQFDVFVKGQTLYFQPQASATNPSRTFTWVPGVNGGPPQFSQERIKLIRSLTLAKDITVTVSSWDRKGKKSYSKSATASHTKSKVLKQSNAAVYDKQPYSYVIANLTPDQCQQRAQQLLADLSKHEMKVQIDGPAETDLDVTDVFALTGTGTAWDQNYHPDSIIRSYSEEDGFGWSITAKNHPAESETTL